MPACSDSTSKVGYEAKFYYNDGTFAVPIWLEIDTVRDATGNLSAGEIDDTSRATGAWRSKAQGLKEWGNDFDMVYQPTNTGWIKLRQAFFNGTIVEVLMLDGDIQVDGNYGLRGCVFVNDFTKNEALEETQTNAVVMVGNGIPTWVVSSGGEVLDASAS